MQKIIIIVRWILGISICMAAIGGINQKDFSFAILSLILGFLLLPPVTKFIFKKRTLNPIGNSFSLFPNRTKKILDLIDYSNSINIKNTLDRVITNQQKPLTDREKLQLGKMAYLKALDIILNDLIITNEEKERLESIKIYFGFNRQQVAELNASINQKAVQSLLYKKYDDKALNEKERNEVIEFATFLNLDKTLVEQISRNIAISIFNEELKVVLNDKLLSPKDETHIKTLLTRLGLGDDIFNVGLSKKILDQIASYKKIWRADNGYLVPLTNTQIGLRKNEECYIEFPCKLVRSETVTAGYKSISNGFSIPLFKGVQYRAGTSYSMPVKENVIITNSGNLYLTDKRIIFIGGSESFDINFENGKLLSFEAYSNGIDFIISGWVYTIKFGSFLENLFSDNEMVDLFCSSLTSCMRYIQNPDDPIYHEALKEVEANAELINV